jgi:hypothetical protein
MISKIPKMASSLTNVSDFMLFYDNSKRRKDMNGTLWKVKRCFFEISPD